MAQGSTGHPLKTRKSPCYGCPHCRISGPRPVYRTWLLFSDRLNISVLRRRRRQIETPMHSRSRRSSQPAIVSMRHVEGQKWIQFLCGLCRRRLYRQLTPVVSGLLTGNRRSPIREKSMMQRSHLESFACRKSIGAACKQSEMTIVGDAQGIQGTTHSPACGQHDVDLGHLAETICATKQAGSTRAIKSSGISYSNDHGRESRSPTAVAQQYFLETRAPRYPTKTFLPYSENVTRWLRDGRRR